MALSVGNFIALPGLLPSFKSQIDGKVQDKSESKMTSSKFIPEQPQPSVSARIYTSRESLSKTLIVTLFGQTLNWCQ